MKSPLLAMMDLLLAVKILLLRVKGLLVAVVGLALPQMGEQLFDRQLRAHSPDLEEIAVKKEESR
jgi:hypothetical protein